MYVLVILFNAFAILLDCYTFYLAEIYFISCLVILVIRLVLLQLVAKAKFLNSIEVLSFSSNI